MSGAGAVVRPPELSQAAREGLYATAHRLFTQERYSDAAAVFRIMLQLAPMDERSWLGLGECHERAGHAELALDLYAAGTIAVVHAARCHLARARMLRADGRTDDAQEALAQAFRIAEEANDEALLELVEKESWPHP